MEKRNTHLKGEGELCCIFSHRSVELAMGSTSAGLEDWGEGEITFCSQAILVNTDCDQMFAHENNLCIKY